MALGHALQDVLEIGKGLPVIELCSCDEGTNGGSSLSPPPSEPANRWFLRRSATGRIARSTELLSSSIRRIGSPRRDYRGQECDQAASQAKAASPRGGA